MSAVPAIQFTQEQARTITGISAETLRHWRRSVRYLAEKTGKSARFSFHDLVCLTITHQLTDAFGVAIGHVHTGVDALFRQLAAVEPPSLESALVILGTSEAHLCPSTEVSKLKLAGPIFAVPCDPLVNALHASLLPGLSANRQPSLPRPPHSVGSES